MNDSADLEDISRQNPFPVFRIDNKGILKFANESSQPVLFHWNCEVGQAIPADWREKLLTKQLPGDKFPEITCGKRTFAMAAVASQHSGYINVYGSEISDRLNFEKALGECEEKYRSLVETSSEGIWVVNMDGTINYANQRIADLLGMRSEDIIGKQMQAFLYPETQQYLSAGNRERRVSGAREKRILRTDGRYLWVLESQSPLLDNSGKKIGILGLLTDLSSQKEDQRLNERLREMNIRLLTRGSQKNLLATMLSDACQALGVEAGAIFVEEKDHWIPQNAYGLPGSYKHASFKAQDLPLACQASREKRTITVEGGLNGHYKSCRAVIDYNIQSALAIPIFLKAMPPRVLYFMATKLNYTFSRNQLDFGNKLAASLSFYLENYQLIQELENQLTENQQIARELKVTQKKLELLLNAKEERLMQTRAHLSDEEGQRKKAENALLKRQQALEAVYEMAVSFESGILSLFEQIALKTSEILEVPFVRVQDFREGKIVHCAVVSEGKLLKEISPHQVCSVCKMTHESKQISQVHGNLQTQVKGWKCFKDHSCEAFIGVPIRDEHNNLLGSICVLDFDNREFSKEETHLLEIFSRYLCHEILQNLLQKQLGQAQEMKLLGELTSGVAHEVRNPLNGIMGIMEALGQEIGEGLDYEPYLMHMRKQVSRLSSLMEDLLELGRSIKKESMRPVKLKPFLEETLISWRQAAYKEGQNIELELSEADAAWTVNMDPDKMMQVMVNLLENAAQHSSEDEAIVIHVERSENNRARISIIDKGIGVSEENLQRIFKPFFTTRRSGTGLGLSIVKRIVESHGGYIEIHNNAPDPGLNVRIHLPLLEKT